jgi:prepilin signal peptidase PulO-like enzyme (type II secretory pathway)
MIDSLYMAIMLFILGALLGSFVNVVVLRWNTGMSISRGRSACFSCGTTLRWFELFPIVSFIAQKGKCRTCGTNISWQYPAVEALAGCAVVIAFMKSGSLAEAALWSALLLVYLALCVYDIRHQIIPDAFSYTAAFLALGLIGWQAHLSGAIDPWRVVAGPILFIFFWLFWFLSRGRAMGFGDAKLALSVGWALGLSSGIAAILLSFWIGAIVALAAMPFSRLSMKSAIPFGPFIVLGAVLAFALSIDLGTVASFFTL